MSETALISIRDAHKRFAAPEGGFTHALRSVTLAVANKEFITLLGPSGCGKTTLLRAISGFEDLDSGEISINSQSMTHVPPHKRPVNTVFQNYALFPHMTVGDNIAYGLDVSGCPRTERKQRLSAALELVGLTGFERRKPRQLSGGQQQRVALARAIINRPTVLLLDEPLSALDRKLRQAMQLELKNIQHELGISFVFVTHDQEEALTMSDRIAVMDHGQIQQIGSPTEIYDQPASVEVARFIGEGNLIDGSVHHSGQELQLHTTTGLMIRFAATAEQWPEGSAATVLIRPEDLTLLTDSEECPTDCSTINARVTQTVFVGTDFQVLAQCDDGTRINATVRDPSRSLSQHLQPGTPTRFIYRMDAPRVLTPRQSA